MSRVSPRPPPRGLWAGPISREPLRAAPREETRGLPGGDRWEAARRQRSSRAGDGKEVASRCGECLDEPTQGDAR